VLVTEEVIIAVTCTLVVLKTPAEVVAVNVTDVEPVSTVTFAGTVTAARLALVSATLTPPAGAGVVTTTVPVAGCPAVTVGGLKNTSLTSGGKGVIVRIACMVEAPTAAVIVAICCVATGSVVTGKLTVMPPAGTVTLGANCATFEVLVSVTTVPLPGAAAVSVTVPTEELPPTTDVGLSARLATVGVGTTTRVAICEVLFTIAVMMADCWVVT
jgi:hypothetical protein